MRSRVCIARGSIPADVLFVGEAPGVSEDSIRQKGPYNIGTPFVGPAGQLLDRMIVKAVQESGVQAPRMCLSNLVGCIPKAEETKRKKVEPLPAEIEACYPRLEELFTLVKPRLVVCVGGLSEKQARIKSWEERFTILNILHPSAILHQDVGERGLSVQRVIVQLSDAFADLMVPF